MKGYYLQLVPNGYQILYAEPQQDVDGISKFEVGNDITHDQQLDRVLAVIRTAEHKRRRFSIPISKIWLRRIFNCFSNYKLSK